MTASVVWTGLVLVFLVIFIGTMIRENQRTEREFLRKITKGSGQGIHMGSVGTDCRIL